MELANGSQATLVNPTNEYLELALEKPGTVMNTRLLVNGKPRYRIATLDRDAAHTKVIDLRTNEEMSSVKRRTFFSTKVQFARRFGGEAIKKDKWMVEGKLETGHDVWVINSESGRFMWRWDVEKRMVLTAENAPDDIIAYVKDEPPVFALMVKPAAEGNLDEIILVFAILEQHLRLGVKALRVADGWGADERSTITGTPLR